MTPRGPTPGAPPRRREPPAFRRAVVARRHALGPRMVRVTLVGAELEGFPVPGPAASVRLLLPSSGSAALALPAWNGNEFLLAEGRRPVIRTLTPRRVDPRRGELDVDVVVHGDGAASRWAQRAAPGDPVAVSGPGRGTALDPAARVALVAGDETALAAVAQLLEGLAPSATAVVLLETAAPGAALALPGHPGATVRWLPRRPGARPGGELLRAVAATELEPGTAVWAAGEAAAMQQLRRHLLEVRGIPRGSATVRGYWKQGRPGQGAEA